MVAIQCLPKSRTLQKVSLTAVFLLVAVCEVWPAASPALGCDWGDGTSSPGPCESYFRHDGGGSGNGGSGPTRGSWNDTGQRAQTLHQQGLEAERQGDYETALSQLIQARALQPDLYNIDLEISVLQSKIEERALRQAAQELNGKGAAAFRSGDYAAAAQYFQQALDKDPGDYDIQKNLDNAKRMVKAYREADEVHTSVVDTLTRISHPPRNNPEQSPPPGKAGLRLMTSGGTNFFGSTKSNPSASELAPAKPYPQVAVHNTAEALSSIEQSSTDAARHSEEEAVRLSRCGFDNAPCKEPTAITIPRRHVQTPAAMEVLSHLPDTPDVRNDRTIQEALARYDSLEKAKAKDALKLADIRKKIAGGKAATAELKKQKAVIEAHLHQQSADQEKAVKQIKKRVINLGRTWNEETAQPGGSQP